MSLESLRDPPLLNQSRTWAIIWPFLAIVVILVALAYFSLNVLAAVRASVTGESAWSKAQKEAVYDLVHYAQSREERDYQRFLRAVEVIHWDRRIREEMDKPVPDVELIREGMVRGHIPKDDIDATYHFYRRFRNFDFMKRVVALWQGGDAGIDELLDRGQAVRRQILAEEQGAPRKDIDLEAVYAIDGRITPMATRFSETLGEVARQLEVILVLSMLAIAATLVPIGSLLAWRMVRKGVDFEQALSVSEERFELAVSGSNDGIWDWNTRTGNLYFSPRLKELLGYRDEDLNADVAWITSRIHPDDLHATRRRFWLQGKHRGTIDLSVRLRVADESYRWFRIRGQAIRENQSRPLRMVGSMSDTTSSRLADDALFAEKERLRVTLEAIGDAVVTTDTEGFVQYLNPAAEALTGWSEDEARDRLMRETCPLIDEQSREPLLTTGAGSLLATGGSAPARNALLVQRQGTEVAVSAVAAPIRDEQQRVLGMVVALRDVSQERSHREELEYQARHDALTGLINRREFDVRLARALESARKEGRPHVVLFLDLDQFKVVNDTCGHAAGDELIRHVAVLLQQRLRVTDTLARLGGDEFGVLLENCIESDGKAIANQLRETMMDFRFAWQGQPFSLGVSIGLVDVHKTAMTPTDVLSIADSVCYLAKERGRNRVQVYEPNDSELLMLHGDVEWASRIREALQENRLQLYAQEISVLNGEEPAGLHIEVLVRMIDTNGVVIPPMAFIPTAERMGLMTEVDRWVIHEAFDTFAKRVRRDGPEAIALCAINVSRASLCDGRFREFVLDKFVEFREDVPFDRICFEITETAVIANLRDATRVMEELNGLGCKFSMDDFGSGMTSFNYLRNMPVEFLKIDGSFVKDMLDDPMNHSMVEAINQIGHVLEKKTIAEFAENAEIIAELQRIGVDYAQGYGVGEPKPFSEPRWVGHRAPQVKPVATI